MRNPSRLDRMVLWQNRRLLLLMEQNDRMRSALERIRDMDWTEDPLRVTPCDVLREMKETAIRGLRACTRKKVGQ